MDTGDGRWGKGNWTRIAPATMEVIIPWSAGGRRSIIPSVPHAQNTYLGMEEWRKNDGHSGSGTRLVGSRLSTTVPFFLPDERSGSCQADAHACTCISSVAV